MSIYFRIINSNGDYVIWKNEWWKEFDDEVY